MMRRTPMKRTGFTGSLRGAEPKSASKLPQPAARFAPIAYVPTAPAKIKTVKRMRSRQRPVTAAEKALWDRMATEVGCIACWLDGHFNDRVSIHHVHGRTAPGCHKKVLPLCGPHHQDDGTALAVHPWKNRWEAKYGKQDDLIAEIYRMIGLEHAP